METRVFDLIGHIEDGDHVILASLRMIGSHNGTVLRRKDNPGFVAKLKGVDDHAHQADLKVRRHDTERLSVEARHDLESEQLLSDGSYAPGTLHVLKRDLSYAALIPDRHAFAEAYPEFAVDPAGIDDIMTLLVKGEVR